MTSPRVGELLVQDGACTPERVREALQNQAIFGARLGTNLLELGAVAEPDLARALGRRHGVPCVHGDVALDPRALALVRPELADRHDVVPYLRADRRLAVLARDPSDLAMLDEVAFATGLRVHPVVAPEARIWALLRRAYGVARPLRGLEVDPARAAAMRGRRPEAAPLAPAADLIDEGAFEALYGHVGTGALPRSAGAPELREADFRALAAPLGGVEPEPSPLAFAEAVRLIEGVDDRDAIARTVLRYARARFRRAVLFTVQRGVAEGWAGLGDGLGRDAVARIRIPLGAPGVVDTVVSTRAHFLGPIPKTEANVRLLKLLGGGVPGNAFLVPILALGRVVNVFYGDAGRGATVDASEVGELLILAARIAQSYETLVARAA